MGRPIIWSGSNAKLINSGDFIDSKNNSLTNASKINITKVGHGWTSSDVGRPLYLNGSVWTLAQADTSATAEIAGFIYAIIDVDTVRVALGGEIPTVGANLLDGGGSLVAGETYFLSPTTAGKITATEPTTLGYVSKPVGIAKSTSSILLYNFRGSVVGGVNARTQISLSNFTTANIQDFSAYEAGEITGWVFIDATTNYQFLLKAQFAKNGAASNWNVAFQTVGDTPPAGFTIGITSGGILQYTLPNITGFSSAYLNYALNAPAVGTNLPLSIDGAAIVSGTVAAARLPVATNTTQGAIPFYTENTWVPSLRFGGNTTGITYAASRYGHYTRIGNRCYFNCYFVLTSKGTATGVVTVAGLPFTAAIAANGGLSAVSIWTSGFSGVGVINAYVGDNSTQVYFDLRSVTANAQAATVVNETNFTNTASVMVSGHYIIA